MTNERFYPAIERKNDFIVKNVKLVQMKEAMNHTTKKTVLKGKKLLGWKCFDIISEPRGLHTEIEYIYE